MIVTMATTDEEEYNNGDEYDDYNYTNNKKIMRTGGDDDDENRECSHWVEDCRPGQPLKVGRQSGREEQSLPRMQ